MNGPAEPGPLQVDASPSLPGFSATKRSLLLRLKREGEADLGSLAKALSVSKMAVYKHIKELEAAGLIERDYRRSGVGRPRLVLRLAPGASSVFPKAYASVTCTLLHFIEERLGPDAVEAALRERHRSVLPEYKKAVTAEDLGGRVRQLAILRDKEGYMAEARGGRRGQFELFEYNCPILAIAEEYGEACTVENELFRKVLRADVETTHRVVAGDHVCRFLIRPRKEIAL